MVIVVVPVFFMGYGIFNQHSKNEAMIMTGVKGSFPADEVNMTAFSYRNGGSAFGGYFMVMGQKEVAVYQYGMGMAFTSLDSFTGYPSKTMIVKNISR